MVIKNIEDFYEILSDKPLPYLFIGSGFSRRYANAPDWEGLLKKISNENNINYNILAYKHKIEGSNKTDCPAVATEIEEELYNSFLEKDKNFDFRDYNPLKKLVCEYLRSLSIIEDEKLDTELIQFREALKSVSGIITTNYDLLLDNLCDKNEFKPVIGQKGLLSQSHTIFVDEIFKIHGCVSDEQSIILTKKDYENFLEKQKYILGKLMVIFTEYPIIFIGYSLDDKNILTILEDLSISLSVEELKKVSEKWIFVSREVGIDDLIIKEHTVYIRENEHLRFNCVQTDNFERIFNFIAKIPHSIAINKKHLKKIKDVVQEYEIAPNGKIAIEIESDFIKYLENDNEDKQIRLNLGVSDKLVKLSSYKIFSDFLFESNLEKYKKAEFIEEYKEKTQPSIYFPRYKFFTKEELANNNISEISIDDLKIDTIQDITEEMLKNASAHKIKEYWLKMYKSGHLDETKQLELEKYLKELFRRFPSMDKLRQKFGNQITNIRKMIVLLDILKYKND